MDKNNDTQKKESELKLNTIKKALSDKDKCKEFTEKLIEFISKDK